MIKVTVLSAKVIEFSGNFKGRDGEEIEYTTRKQDARMESGGFAYPYDVRLEEGEDAYPLGDYELDVERMIAVNKKTHSLGKYTKLQPLKVAAK